MSLLVYNISGNLKNEMIGFCPNNKDIIVHKKAYKINSGNAMWELTLAFKRFSFNKIVKNIRKIPHAILNNRQIPLNINIIFKL